MKSDSNSKKVLTAIAYTSILLVAGYSLWFIAVPWLGEKAVVLIPKKLEIEVGEKLSEIYFSGTNKNDSASYYTSAFVKRLKFEHNHDITISVISSDNINAFAMPGGKIVIFSALLENMNSYEQLVALFGHELTHVTERHSLKSICRQAAGSLLFSGVIGDVGGIGSGIMAQANNLKELKYSRELETEADNMGLELMQKNSINQQGMIELLKMLEEEGEENPGLMKYFSTHPEIEERIVAVRAKIKNSEAYPANIELETIFDHIQRVLAQ